MRLIPLLTALLIAAGLYYWFGFRHDAETGPVGEPGGVAMSVRADAPLADSAPEGGAVADAAADAAPDASSADPRDAPVPVVVLPSQARETSTELTLRGRTRPDRSVQVAAETTGRVVSPPLRRGATVQEGQVLCQLDEGTRSAERVEAEASLEEAQVQASGASQLARKGYAADTELKQRQAQLRAAQARLDKVRADIAKLEIRAPFSGVLETDTAELGTLLSMNALCAEVVDLDPLTVESYVSEQEVDRLSVGQAADVRLVNGVTARGEITFISRSGDEQTRTFDVEVTVPNPDRAIRAGVTAEVLVALPPRLAHLVPQTALTLDDDGRLGVRTAEDGIVDFHAVTILGETPDGVWVDGLPPRADVIVIGQEFVREGRRVEVTPISESAMAVQGEAQPGAADGTLGAALTDAEAPAATDASGSETAGAPAATPAEGSEAPRESGPLAVAAPRATETAPQTAPIPEIDAATTDAAMTDSAAIDAAAETPSDAAEATPGDAPENLAVVNRGEPFPVPRPEIVPDQAGEPSQ